MTIVHEAFRADDGSVGVLLRSYSSSGTRFLTCFAEPDGTVYRVVIRVVHTGSPGGWTSLEMADHVGGTIATLGAREVSPGMIPSYADVLVVEDMVASDLTSFRWSRLDESTLTGADATLHQGEPGEVAGLDGEAVPATPYVLATDGVRANTFWVADGRVVVSDWSGARSYLVDDLDTALRGASGDVAQHARSWVAGPGSR